MAEVVAITGATGLVGKALAGLLLAAGHEVRSISRRADQFPIPGVETFSWNPSKQEIDPQALQGATVVVNLAGENIGAKRWTEERKQAIYQSRVKAAQTLAVGLERSGRSVHTVIGMSAIGYYAPNGVPVNETGQLGDTFLAEVCQAWEDAQTKMAAGRRLVLLRSGVVLSRDGGVLSAFRAPMKVGLGFWFGEGLQVVTWIHIRDLVSLIIYSIEKETMEGVYNAVAYEPCSQKYFIQHLCRYLHVVAFPWGIPDFLVKVILGELSSQVLEGTPVISTRLNQTGFRFRYPYLYEALRELSRKRRPD